MKSVIIIFESPYIQVLFLILHNWYLSTNYGDMPIWLPYPTLGITCSSGTLEGIWKLQPGCKGRHIEREQISEWSASVYPLRFIWTVFAHFLSMPPGPCLYCSCPSLGLESSLPHPPPPHLLFQLPNFHSAFKGCSSNNSFLPKTIWHLFCYRLFSNNILTLQSTDIHLYNCVII